MLVTSDSISPILLFSALIFQLSRPILKTYHEDWSGLGPYWLYPATVPTKPSFGTCYAIRNILHYTAKLKAYTALRSFGYIKTVKTHSANSHKYPSETKQMDEAFVTDNTKVVMVVMATDYLTMLYVPAG